MMWDRFNAMTVQELDAEIYRMTNLFFKQRPGSNTHRMLTLAISQARQVMTDKRQVDLTQEKIKDKNFSAPINIGEIQESIYTPDYSDPETIIDVAKSYTGRDNEAQ